MIVEASVGWKDLNFPLTDAKVCNCDAPYHQRSFITIKSQTVQEN